MAGKRKLDEPLDWQDAAALLIVVGVVVWLLYLFADAIDADAAFTAARLAAHQQECSAAQEVVRLAEVTR